MKEKQNESVEERQFESRDEEAGIVGCAALVGMRKRGQRARAGYGRRRWQRVATTDEERMEMRREGRAGG